MRRMISIAICMMLLALPRPVFAEQNERSAKAYLLMPLHSDVVLEEKNAQERYSVAGLAKLPAILTLCHAFDTGLLSSETEMQVSKAASRITGPTAFLEAGESIPAGELMKAAVMISAGDAICTLMENAFGSEEVFLQNIGVILNDASVDLTLKSCLGTGTEFSAVDLLRLGTLAAESKTFLEYSVLYMDSLQHQSGSTTELVNANRMIRTYSGCIGLLTGSSREDGYCGIFLTKRNEMRYLCCVIGSASSEDRFSETTRLFDFAYANFRSETPAQKGTALLENYPVLYGDAKAVDLIPKETVVLLLNKADGAVETVYELPEALLAPLNPETSVGKAAFRQANGEVLATIDLYPAAEVRSNGFSDILRRILSDYLAN